MDAEARKQQERDTYNRRANMERPSYSSFWDRELYDALFSVEYHEDLERIAQRYLKGKKVLILGAGVGEVNVVSRYADSVSAVNISERAVAHLQKTCPHVHSFVGDAEQLDAVEEYDAVYCRSILHHLHPFEEVVRRIQRALRPDGILLVASEPGLYNPFAALGRQFTPSQQHTPGEKAFVLSRYSETLGKYFEPLFEQDYFVLSMLIPILGKRLPRLRPLLRAAIKPVLSVERAVHRLPRARDLYWITCGAYRRRAVP